MKLQKNKILKKIKSNIKTYTPEQTAAAKAYKEARSTTEGGKGSLKGKEVATKKARQAAAVAKRGR